MKNSRLFVQCPACGFEIDLRKIKYSDCYRYSEKEPKNIMVFPCRNCFHIITHQGYIMNKRQLKI